MTPVANPTLDWLRLAPALAPVVGLVLVLALDALWPRRHGAAVAIAVLSLTIGASAAVPGALSTADRPVLSLCLPGGLDGACLWSAGPVASTLQIGVLASAVAALLLLLDHRRGDAVDVVLVLAAAAGGVAVASARELGTWLVMIELATIPLVVLVALRGAARAVHAATTLLLTSLLSFALLVLGAALWFTATSDPSFSSVSVRAAWADPTSRPVLLLGLVSLLAGLAFKLSLVPFHAWTPGAWAEAPLPVTALLASTSKLAATGALLVVLEPFVVPNGLDPRPHTVTLLLGTLAIASMVVGTVVALRASDVVRLLAWSTLAQGGWIVLPLAALTAAGSRASAAYALAYAGAALVALAAVSCVRSRRLTAYKGLIRSHPVVGLPLALALLIFAGLPPGVIGLITKVVALRAPATVGLWPLGALAVVGVVLGIAVYARWLAVLVAPAGDGDDTHGDALGQARAQTRDDPSTEPAVVVGRGALAVLVLGTVLLVVASAVPQVLFGLLG